MIFTLPSNVCQLAFKCILLIFKPTKQKTNIGSDRDHTVQTNINVPQEFKVQLQKWLSSMTLYSRVPMFISAVTSSRQVIVYKYISNINYFSQCQSFKHIHANTQCIWQWHMLNFPPENRTAHGHSGRHFTVHYIQSDMVYLRARV